MKKKPIIILIQLILSLELLGQKQLVDFVDPFIGVRDDASNCVIGPQLPFGSINPSPHTNNGSQDCYSPNEPIRGFSQLHVSGTGWGKYGQILFSPQIGLAIGDKDHDSDKSIEHASAYEYSVLLNRYNIKVDVTPSKHSAIYRFTYPKSDNAHLVLDLSHSVTDIVPDMHGGILNGELRITGNSNNEIKGYGEYEGGFGDAPYKVYFVAKINTAPESFGTWRNGIVNYNSTQDIVGSRGEKMGCFFHFSTEQNQEIFLKVAVSLKSIKQAEYWLEQEIEDFAYDSIKLAAKDIWNKQLSKIEIETDENIDKTIFYTALYHSCLMPRDRTNDSEFFADNVPVWDDHFTIWDTWRTLFPLYTLIEPGVVAGTINSFIARFETNGMVKDAYISTREMIQEQGGNNIDNIIADAFIKNVCGVDWRKAYRVVLNNAENERNGSWSWNKGDSTNTYKTLGWIANGRMANSMTMEYAYNDYCVAQMAKKMGSKKEYHKYLNRSNNWQNLWNPRAESDGFKGFIDSRNADGSFVGIDYKAYPGSWEMHFYEGSSWTYSWFTPHQFPKLVEFNGGPVPFADKLKYGFDNSLIDYGNEPAFLAVYGFLYCNRADLASYYVNKLMNERFTTIGYSGNDDSGAMSSWYIFSALGFFPNAGQDIYYLIGPKFKKSTIKMGNSKRIVISAPNVSKENIYVKSVSVNGKKVNTPWISHHQIVNGAIIEFEMTDKPNN